MADPRGHRARAAHGRPRRDDREHRAAVGPGRPRLRRRLAPVGDHGLRARVRLPAPARRKDQRPRSAASGPSSPGWSDSPAPRRSAAPLRRSRSWSAARVLQGAFAALLAPAALSIVTTTFTDPAGARQGVRHLRRDRERRRRPRAPARRVPHRAPDLALDHVREPGLRDPGGDRALATAREHAPGRAPDASTYRASLVATSGLFALGLRVLQRRDGQLERPAHRRPARPTASSRSRRSSQSSGGWPRRSCRCEWSATATAAQRSWRSRSPASRCSRRSCS